MQGTETANIEIREPTVVDKDSKEYNRIKFSLKMALRMSNGVFDQFEIKKYRERGVNFEEEHDKATIECWYVPKSQFDAEQIRQD